MKKHGTVLLSAYLTTLEPFAVHGFCEPDRVVCTVSYWNAYIVFESDELPDKNAYREMYGVSLNMLDFCKQLYNDISNNLDAWVRWDISSLREEAELKYNERPGDEYIEADFENVLSEIYDVRKKELSNRLGMLNQLICDQAKHFGPSRGFF